MIYGRAIDVTDRTVLVALLLAGFAEDKVARLVPGVAVEIGNIIRPHNVTGLKNNVAFTGIGNRVAA